VGTLRELRSSADAEQVYYLYIPPDYDGSSTFHLLAIIHGLSRGAERYAESFVEFADRHHFVLLAPLFPPPLRFQDLGLGSDVRVDLRLLELVDEVAGDLTVQTAKFDLFGYSGGGQFVHRFLYLRPERLRSVVVGAPGTVTLPNSEERWPIGVRGLARAAGVRFSLEEVRRPRTMLMVGAEDVMLEDLNQRPWAMQAGSTRLGRARHLHAAWLAAGIEHEYVEIPGAGHGLDERFVEPATRFLAAGLET